MMRSTSFLVMLLAFVVCLSSTASAQQEADEFVVPPDDSLPSSVRQLAHSRILSIFVDAGASGEQVVADLASIWNDDLPVLDAVILSFAKYDPQVKAIVDSQSDESWKGTVPELLTDESTDEYLRANLRVYVGRELVRRQFVDEGLAVLESVASEQIADPATYHFYRAVCLYQLQRSKEAIAALQNLDADEDVPPRYVATAAMMRSILETLKREKLDGIAHDMRDLRRRLELGRTNEKVRALEKDIIERLEKLIKSEEDKRRENQQSGGGAQSSSPAEDSRIAGGKGEGKVGERSFKNKDSWGTLPEKEREKVMQNIGRQFPAHYSDAIKEYFRKLADSKSNK